MPEISVIIPCYKAADTITRCLDSLTSQEAPVEIVVVEDCSNDGTLEAVENYFAVHQECKHAIIRHETNKGVSASRNDGLEAASCRFVMFLDADDELDASCCKRLLGLAEARNADIACCNLMHKYTDGHTRPYFAPVKEVSQFSGKDYRRTMAFNALMDSCVGKLYRKEFIASHNLSFDVNMRFGEDTLFTNHAVLESSVTVVDGGYFGYVYLDNSSSCINTVDLDARLRNLEVLLTGLKGFNLGAEDRLLLRKASEYMWSIRKFGGSRRREIASRTCRGALWHDILYPVIRRHGKLRHKIVAWLLSKGCSGAISLW